MEMTSISLRKDLVDNVEQYLTQIGSTWDELIETAINDPFYSKQNQDILKHSISQLESGKNSRLWLMGDITFSEQGFDDYLYWQREDKKMLRKINDLLPAKPSQT